MLSDSADMSDNGELTEPPAHTNAERARHELLDLSITAAGIGTFDLDLFDGALRWDARLLELFGYEAHTFTGDIDAFNARVHPEDLARVTKEMNDSIASRLDFQSEYRIVVPEGEIRWIGARGRTLRDENGNAVRFLGAAWDTTARIESDAMLARGLESMASAYFSLSEDWRFTYANSHAERILGLTREELIGHDLWELFPSAVGSDFEKNYVEAMETGRHVAFDAYYPAPLDAWFEVRAWRNADGLAVYFLDVTERHNAHRQAEEAARRAQLLSQITEELAGTLDSDEASRRLARLVVPTLADWCIVTLIDDDRQAGSRRGLRNVVAHHVDPAMQATADEYAATRLEAMNDHSLVVRALQTGKTQFLSGNTVQSVQAMMEPGSVHSLIAQLAPSFAAVLPLPGRNGPVGLLTLANGEARGEFTNEDVVTAEHVSARAGLVMDNARLYRQQRQLAEGLQRSLLTPPAEPDHLQVVVRYTPASEAAQVGGDWYDAFMQPGGALMVVIGDVIGHDTQAASAMGQLRAMVRTIGAVGNDTPAEVLRKVDGAMETLQINTSATAFIGRIEQTDDELQRGVTRFLWSNAGHPPPFVISSDGRTLPLQSIESDPLLGAVVDFKRNESEVAIDRDSLILLYTDGLVERRGQSIDEGLRLLQKQLQDLADRDLDDLCDELLLHMLPKEPEDDVALLAVRLHRQDKPRPPEAGPNRIPPNVDNYGTDEASHAEEIDS